MVSPRGQGSGLSGTDRESGGLAVRRESSERAGVRVEGLGAGVTHADGHVPPHRGQQLQGSDDAGVQLGARQAAQHLLGVGEAPRHQAEPRAGLRVTRRS